jgi:hypothetical protein
MTYLTGPSTGIKARKIADEHTVNQLIRTGQINLLAQPIKSAYCLLTVLHVSPRIAT